MTISTTIQSVLHDHLEALTLSPVAPVALPGRAFVPPQKTGGQGSPARWLRGTFLPADTSEVGMEFGSYENYVGLYQVDVFFEQGFDEWIVRQVADLVSQHFGRGTTLYRDDLKIVLPVPPSSGRLMSDHPWVMIPVRTRWQCFART